MNAEQTLSEQEIAAELAQLQLSFPTVAPRLLQNLTLDRDPFFGFNTPVLRLQAEHQIPFLLESYVEIGAFVADNERICGLRPAFQHRITDETGKTAAAKAAYFKGFADFVGDKILENKPSKMAAFNVALSLDSFEKLYEKVRPLLKQILAEEDVALGHPASIVFCAVLDPRKDPQ